jgi:hypothetical protein
LKKRAVIALITLFVISIVAKDVTALGWEIWYLTNKEYVAKNLCENKKKPQLKCNGKCHLAKRLQELEESTPVPKKNPAPHSLKIKETDWIQNGMELIVIYEYVAQETLQLFGGKIIETAPRSFINPVFHPPALA